VDDGYGNSQKLFSHVLSLPFAMYADGYGQLEETTMTNNNRKFKLQKFLIRI